MPARLKPADVALTVGAWAAPARQPTLRRTLEAGLRCVALGGRRGVRVAALAVACLVMAGCTSTTSPAPTAAVSPTYSCTSADGTSVSPCSKESYDAAEQHLALVEEAKGVYRRQYAEAKRLVLAGGVSDLTPTPEIEATMADPARHNYMLALQGFREEGTKAVSLDWKLTMRESSKSVESEAIMTLESCEDSRGSVFVDKAGQDLGESEIVHYFWGFKRLGGSLKMYASEAGVVATCPF